MNPPKFKTVKQPKGSMVCVAAVAAMATGHTLAEVESHIVPLIWENGKRYYPLSELIRFLGGCGVSYGVSVHTGEPLKVTRNTRFTVEIRMTNPAILLVDSFVNSDWTHLIFWDGKKVRDPNPDVKKAKLSDYTVHEIVPLAYIEEA